jgi:hypothetical protein
MTRIEAQNFWFVVRAILRAQAVGGKCAGREPAAPAAIKTMQQRQEFESPFAPAGGRE